MHTCSEDCFVTHNQRIRQHIENKLDYYRRRDARSIFVNCQPTITLEDAYTLLEASKGICSICENQVKLHDWSPKYPYQFSFDRLDDSDTHHRENLQITCLECNICKAAERYKPSSFSSLDEYAQAMNEFLELHQQLQDRQIIHDNAVRNYSYSMRRYLSYMHDLVYGNRKKNGWARYGSSIVRPQLPQLRYRYTFSDELVNEEPC